MKTTAAAGQLAFDLFGGQRADDIRQIHAVTGVYTRRPEVDRLLDALGWPDQGQRLLDPGAGNGEFLVAALSRLDLGRDDTAEAVRRVRGYEFHPGAVADARQAIRDHLTGRGWSPAAAREAATAIVAEHDFLLSPVPEGQWDCVAGNPPYLRRSRLPGGYRADFEAAVASHAREDMLYAFIEKAAQIIAPGGQIGLITADRWLTNGNAARLRARIGELFRVASACRLDAESSFYRPKPRKAGTLARVHPVRLVLTPSAAGCALSAEPFRIVPVPKVDGIPLPQIARIRTAPWLGAHGCFTVGAGSGLPPEYLVPVAEPEDLSGDVIRPASKWALVTSKEATPPPAVLAHVDANLHRISPGKRRDPRWLPPETFTGRLPLDHDAVLVPRIAQCLRALRLPAGTLPVGHNLVVISGLPVDTVLAMLACPDVQAQAAALADGVDSGYFSYTATLLRELVIPHQHLTQPLVCPSCTGTI